ncbi:hypothetical protein KCP73_21935 [Salmonella enterica subsp. enterica]|nr:hypothetical protein KCP73_21935 [Salmonella enterica subsp. enterica]
MTGADWRGDCKIFCSGFSDSVAAFYVCAVQSQRDITGHQLPPMRNGGLVVFENERGRWWAIAEAAHNIGGSPAPLLTSFCYRL